MQKEIALVDRSVTDVLGEGPQSVLTLVKEFYTNYNVRGALSARTKGLTFQYAIQAWA